jgi:hypothetical protein
MQRCNEKRQRRGCCRICVSNDVAVIMIPVRYRAAGAPATRCHSARERWTQSSIDSPANQLPVTASRGWAASVASSPATMSLWPIPVTVHRRLAEPVRAAAHGRGQPASPAGDGSKESPAVRVWMS